MDYSLYFVATPIGNLEDMTYRAVRILQEVDKIYCEDTRVSKTLLRHYDIDTEVTAYHDHNKEQMTPRIIEYIKEKHTVAIISDAGMPLISDPGYMIRDQLIKEGISFSIIPGPSALLTGLSVSNQQVHPFYFHGFLDAKRSKRMRELSRLKNKEETLVFYESVHRVSKVLSDMYEIFGDRNITIARELTKRYEDVIYTTLQDFDSLPVQKGEFVLVVSGKTKDTVEFKGSILEEVKQLINEGMKEKQAIKQVAKRRNLVKNVVYMEYHSQKE